jgi:hypothetical protein
MGEGVSDMFSMTSNKSWEELPNPPFFATITKQNNNCPISYMAKIKFD